MMRPLARPRAVNAMCNGVWRRSLSSSGAETPARKVALVMGVANHRSIAWATVESFLRHSHDFDCVVTYQSERFRSSIVKLIHGNDRILGAVPVDVTTDLPQLFAEDLPNLLSPGERRIHAIVHSVAYGNLQGSLWDASWEDFTQAQHVSAYSLLETARCALRHGHLLTADPALTTLSYLGAVRAVPNYHIMGPAKAALEALVRGLAAEPPTGHPPQRRLRVNAVSAGPLPTVSARSIPGFAALYRQQSHTGGVGGPVTAQQVADTIRFLSTEGTGINGQVLYVDGGFSSRVDLGLPTSAED